MIDEGGDLPSQLSIVKTGQNSMNISFRVTVTDGTATRNDQGRPTHL